MDPISTGALGKAHQNVFEQAEQQIQKSNQQVSDFEKLRQKLEQPDAASNPQVDQAQKIQNALQKHPVEQTGQADAAASAQKVGGLDAGKDVPKIKNMDELQGMVNDIKHGQGRLNQLISEATSGKTYSPSEMIAMQAEVGKITTQLEMATKVVENFVSSVKTTLNIQF